jgi:hypothetical protein
VIEFLLHIKPRAVEDLEHGSVIHMGDGPEARDAMINGQLRQTFKQQ